MSEKFEVKETASISGAPYGNPTSMTNNTNNSSSSPTVIENTRNPLLKAFYSFWRAMCLRIRAVQSQKRFTSFQPQGPGAGVGIDVSPEFVMNVSTRIRMGGGGCLFPFVRPFSVANDFHTSLIFFFLIIGGGILYFPWVAFPLNSVARGQDLYVKYGGGGGGKEEYLISTTLAPGSDPLAQPPVPWHSWYWFFSIFWPAFWGPAAVVLLIVTLIADPGIVSWKHREEFERNRRGAGGGTAGGHLQAELSVENGAPPPTIDGGPVGFGSDSSGAIAVVSSSSAANSSGGITTTQQHDPQATLSVATKTNTSLLEIKKVPVTSSSSSSSTLHNRHHHTGGGAAGTSTISTLARNQEETSSSFTSAQEVDARSRQCGTGAPLSGTNSGDSNDEGGLSRRKGYSDQQQTSYYSSSSATIPPIGGFKQQQQDQEGQQQQQKKSLYCNQGEEDRYQGTEVYYCPVCWIYVDGFDHHCGIIGACIGKGTMPWFVSFLGSVCAYCGVGFWFVGHKMVYWWHYSDHPAFSYSAKLKDSWTVQIVEPIIYLGLLVVCVLATAFCAGFFFYYGGQCLLGLQSLIRRRVYENMKENRKKSGSGAPSGVRLVSKLKFNTATLGNLHLSNLIEVICDSGMGSPFKSLVTAPLFGKVKTRPSTRYATETVPYSDPSSVDDDTAVFIGGNHDGASRVGSVV